MLLSQSALRHAVLFLMAVMSTTLLFTASAADARSKPVVYTAELQEPVEASQFIIKGTVIQCAGTTCKGAKSGSSVRTVCARLARKAGPLASFSFKGEAIDSAALEKCNG